MSKDKTLTCSKNMICISVGLLIIFTTSIFVAKDYFGLQIQTLIDEATLLKDYHFSDWGQYPGNIDADYQYTITMYNYSANAMMDQGSVQPLAPITFKHSFAYKNVSFGQGNQGFIKYLHHWNIDPINSIPQVKLNTLNIEAERVYGYEKLATETRRFTTMYNVLWESVEKMLIKFYAIQLHQFYFQHQQVVVDAVFKEIGLEPTVMNAIYTNEQFGWNNVENFETWVMLTHLSNRKNISQYETIQDELGLSEQTMQRLVGPHSMLNILSNTMNGTIKLILQNNKANSPYKDYNYKNCVPFCNNNQLVAFQLLTGNLTKSTIFVNVNIDKKLAEFNQTYWKDLQFNIFCGTSGSQCTFDQNMVQFFAQKFYADYDTMSKVFQNIDNLQIVRSLFGFDDNTYTQSVIDYIKYLQSNIFNPTSQLTQQIDEQAYSYMLNNHLYINRAVNGLKEILNVELHARGLKQMIQNQGIKCEDFFTGNYEPFKGNCTQEELNFNTLKGVRTYVKAYFFEGREEFAKKTSMKYQQLVQFLKLDGNSLFAAKMKELRATVKTNYNCEKKYCSSEELLWLQWSGETDVLSNLPKELFPSPPKSIIEWDVQGILNGVQPQYYKVMSQKLSYQQGKQLLGNGPESIINLFNLLQMKTKADSNDPTSIKLVNYVQRVTIDIYFNGPSSNRYLSELMQGYKSKGIVQKQNQDGQMGGASWLQAKVVLFKTKYQSDNFNKINTGIYDRSLLRNMIEFNHNNQLGSEFTVFQNEDVEVKEFIPSGRRVFGTNLLGFHSDISNTESLSVFLDFIYQGVILTPSESSSSFIDGLETIKYSIKQSSTKTYIGIDEQNQRSITISPQSYFIIDPITGNTLQFLIKYTVTSNPSFLKYYYMNEPAELKLYTSEIYYSRSDVSAIQKIANEKSSLKVVYLILIVFASLSMISIVVFTVILRIKSKTKARQLNDTLISSVSDGSLINNP